MSGSVQSPHFGKESLSTIGQKLSMTHVYQWGESSSTLSRDHSQYEVFRDKLVRSEVDSGKETDQRRSQVRIMDEDMT